MSIARARTFRRQMSPPEARLWVLLRRDDLRALHFRRQVPLGPYYADFASHPARLVIEVDGIDHTTDAAIARDARRDVFLRAEGYRVLRFTAGDVLNRLDAVYLKIRETIAPLTPPTRCAGGDKGQESSSEIADA